MEFTGEIHPLADQFPMLPDDELDELAASIKADGLLEPIVLDNEGTLVDGRNRLKACGLAGVEPRFISLNGHDPVAYILARNINRRHMNAGQRAMITALAYPEAQQRGRGNKSLLNNEFDASYLRQARTVLQWGRDDLVPVVLSGAKSLSEAYAESIKRKRGVEEGESEFEELQKAAPDLATLVTEERMTLREALGALTERERKRKEDIAFMSDRLSKAIKTATDVLDGAERRAYAIDLFSDEQSYLDEPLTRVVISNAARNLEQLAKEWPR